MSRKIQKTTPLQRIVRVMEYLYRRGGNKESVNKIYIKLIRQKLKL